MKALKSFFAVFLLVVFVGLGAQAQNTNPRWVPDLNLTDTQIKQLDDIDNIYEEKNKENMKSIASFDHEKRDVSAFYKNMKALEEEKLEEQKKVLTQEQLSFYEGYVMEKEMDRKGNMLAQQMKRMNKDYPGMEFTEEQNIVLFEKNEKLKDEGWMTKETIKSYQDAQLEIYQEILDDRQFALYEKIEQGKRELREAKILKEYKKAIIIADEILPIIQDFTLPKFRVLRNKLDSKISPEDKLEIIQLRNERLHSFEKVMNQMVNEDFSSAQFKDPELIRNIELTKSMVEDNADILSNAWSPDWENFFAEETSRAQILTQKYKKEIDELEAELLWTIKETVKKSAIVVAEEYPIPPVAMILSQITEFPDEANVLFLLLDTEMDFDLEMPGFGTGEGSHFASVYPNPAVKNQTLDFFLQKDAHVLVEILDESGRVLKTLASANMYKGNQKLNVNTSDLNSQLYFYRITAGEEVTMLKFTVVR